MKITRQFSIKDGFLTMLSFIEDEFGDYPAPLKFVCCIDNSIIEIVKKERKESPGLDLRPYLVVADFTDYPLHVVCNEMKYFMDIALLFVSPSNQNDYVSQTLPQES